MDKQFEDKVVLITGSSSGIGKQTAKQFLEQGAKVVINARTLNDVAQQTMKDFSIFGESVYFIAADISNAQEVKALIDGTIAKYKHLDVIVTSAGINHIGKVAETSEEAWDLVMDINLKGTFLCCKAAIPYLKKTKGCIITVSSDVAVVPSTTIPVYSISKSGVSMLTRTLAAELATSGVRVNAVMPANVVPGLRNNLVENDGKQEWVIDDASGPDWVLPPIGRFGEASEVADAILFFASDQSKYCTGSSLLIDGALNAAQA